MIYAAEKNNSKLYGILLDRGANDQSVDYYKYCNPCIRLRDANSERRSKYISLCSVLVFGYCVCGTLGIGIIIVLAVSYS